MNRAARGELVVTPGCRVTAADPEAGVQGPLGNLAEIGGHKPRGALKRPCPNILRADALGDSEIRRLQAECVRGSGGGYLVPAKRRQDRETTGVVGGAALGARLETRVLQLLGDEAMRVDGPLRARGRLGLIRPPADG